LITLIHADIHRKIQKSVTEVAVVRRKAGKNTNGSFKKIWIILLSIILIALVVFGWIFWFEGKEPKASLDEISTSIGNNTKIVIPVSDEGRGLKEVSLFLNTGEREILLDQKKFEPKGFMQGTGVYSYEISFKFNPRELALEDTMATLRLLVRDSSYSSFFKGNKLYLQKDVIIDTTPPDISVLSRQHYITPGGAGLVCYKVSELDSKDGVMVGDEFFPGYSGYINDPHYKIAFFALDHRAEKNSPLYIVAQDRAGNEKKAGFPYYIRNASFKTDRINISDNFLAWKMPEFNVPVDDPSDLVEKFLFINNEYRIENSKKLTKVSENTENKKLWDTRFIQMGGSAKRAGFADHRFYYYKNKKIDDAYHMGLDLASVSNAQVPAANSGIVAEVDTIGIYGLTVTIDHGFGLFSCYSHLSQADVKKGDRVEKGQVIGRTGTTGMAVGDHLHFGIFINKRFVDPIEWLDGNWIKNNITSKLDLLLTYQ
jgi:murein DD-endopeptidase MepM/ murein hydrolase activator NlpD